MIKHSRGRCWRGFGLLQNFLLTGIQHSGWQHLNDFTIDTPPLLCYTFSIIKYTLDLFFTAG